MWTDNEPATSSSVTTDGRFFEQDKAERIMSQDSKLAVGIRELLGLLRLLGEGFRLSCLFKCQVWYGVQVTDVNLPSSDVAKLILVTKWSGSIRSLQKTP